MIPNYRKMIFIQNFWAKKIPKKFKKIQKNQKSKKALWPKKEKVRRTFLKHFGRITFLEKCPPPEKFQKNRKKHSKNLKNSDFFEWPLIRNILKHFAAFTFWKKAQPPQIWTHEHLNRNFQC